LIPPASSCDKAWEWDIPPLISQLIPVLRFTAKTTLDWSPVTRSNVVSNLLPRLIFNPQSCGEKEKVKWIAAWDFYYKFVLLC
jgi:hypothetical protein